MPKLLGSGYSTGSGLGNKMFKNRIVFYHCDIMILLCSLHKYYTFPHFCNGRP